MQIVEIIRYASIFSVIVPLAIYGRYARAVPYHIHAVGVFLGTSFLFDLIVMFFYSKGRSTEFLFNFQDVVQYIALAWLYFDILFKGNEKLQYAYGLLHYLTSFLLFMLTTELLTYQQSIWVVSSGLLICYSIAFFIKIYRTTPKEYIWRLGITWINAGVLVYFGLVVWFYLFMEQLLKLPPDTFRSIWAAHNTLNIVKCIFFSVGIFYTTRTIHVTLKSNQRNPGYGKDDEERTTTEESDAAAYRTRSN